MPPEEPTPKVDYAAIVARAAQLKATTTLATIIDNNMEHFRGFADAGADLQTAITFVAEQENCNADSLRRTFLDRMGHWSAFRKGGGWTAPAVPLATPTAPNGTPGNVPAGATPYDLVFGGDDDGQ